MKQLTREEKIEQYLFENNITKSNYCGVKYDNEDICFYINIEYLTDKLYSKVNPYGIWSESEDDYYNSNCLVVIDKIIPKQHRDFIHSLLKDD